MIRVLVVEDSATARMLLVALLGAERDFEVVGEAENGARGVELAEKLRPDVITMDVRMPVLDGLGATEQIMEHTPTPIVIVSASFLAGEVAASMAALRSGALTVVSKPESPTAPGFAASARELVDTVRAMAGVKVVRRWRRTSDGPPGSLPPLPLAQASARTRARVVAIATSTGGPAALAKVLGDLPADHGTPILLVQHIALGFAEGFVSWLDGICRVRVQIARDRERLSPGTVYVAPDGSHLGLRDAETIRVDATAPPIEGFRPSATLMFRSVAEVIGAGTLGVILTGMGHDGVEGLRELKYRGGAVIAQDRATSVVFGMPAAAIAAGVADEVLAIDQIAAAIRARTA